jgi:hypothetical protein
VAIAGRDRALRELEANAAAETTAGQYGLRHQMPAYDLVLHIRECGPCRGLRLFASSLRR